MSYCRFGAYSDVYCYPCAYGGFVILLATEGLPQTALKIVATEKARRKLETRKDCLTELERLSSLGFRIPIHAFARLREEIAQEKQRADWLKKHVGRQVALRITKQSEYNLPGTLHEGQLESVGDNNGQLYFLHISSDTSVLFSSEAVFKTEDLSPPTIRSYAIIKFVPHWQKQ